MRRKPLLATLAVAATYIAVAIAVVLLLKGKPDRQSLGAREQQLVVRLSDEAAATARSLSPDPVLRQLSIEWPEKAYKFRFTDRALTQEIIVDGPYTDPGLPQWHARSVSKEFSNLLSGPRVALDI